MFDASRSDEVLGALGQKAIDALGRAVVTTRTDLQEYRAVFPRFVAEATQRGLHNWLHDRMFANALAEVDSLPDVAVIDREPIRDLYFGGQFRVRMKAHHAGDLVTAYPTAASLDFYSQGWQPTFPSMEEVRLVAGYRWDPELRQMNEAVISYRDGREKVLWAVELIQATQSGIMHFKPHELPPMPEIELGDLGDQGQTEEL